MNGYKAFFNGKTWDVYAATKFEAYKKAVEHFKPAKSKAHTVYVELCELDGKQVTHVAVD